MRILRAFVQRLTSSFNSGVLLTKVSIIALHGNFVNSRDKSIADSQYLSRLIYFEMIAMQVFIASIIKHFESTSVIAKNEWLIFCLIDRSLIVIQGHS